MLVSTQGRKYLLPNFLTLLTVIITSTSIWAPIFNSSTRNLPVSKSESMLSLPVELWRLIASSLSKHDLTRLGVTCSRLFHIVRPILYRDVLIEAEGQRTNAYDILTLLAQDKSLAKLVVNLTLHRELSDRVNISIDVLPTLPSLINPEVLVNLTSLKCVSIYGPVFRNALEGRMFLRVLSTIPIESFAYFALGPRGIFPHDEAGAIGSLKHLWWSSDEGSCAFVILFYKVEYCTYQLDLLLSVLLS